MTLSGLVLSNPFDQNRFKKFIQEFLPDFEKDERKVDTGNSGFESVSKLGNSDSLSITVLIVKTNKNIESRITLTNSSFKVLKAHNIYRALIVYLNHDESIWRFSLLTAVPSFDSTGKVVINYSNPRRHSYVLGTEIGIATARKYLSTLGPIKDYEDLQLRFSVETVNKDFYKAISNHFYLLVGDENNSRSGAQNLDFVENVSDEDRKNYAVRLLGRIVFLWFLKQKTSSGGLELLPSVLLDIKGKSEILEKHLQPIFFEVLNKESKNRKAGFSHGDFANVPYLNGGLFHPSEGASGDHYNRDLGSSSISIKDDWFFDLFETLNSFNFTLDENLENDVDLSIDPEMLGRIFENLLAEINPETGKVARKSTGSYYTPRSIVNLMVDKSLLAYLTKEVKTDSIKLQALISTDRQDDLQHPLSAAEKAKVVTAIKKLKILDPACGSGAYPIGILQKLLWILSQVDPSGEDYLDSADYVGTENWLSDSRKDYLRKQKIIRDTIFGVDIQSIAVEIAKLRCFLTLIVDQEIDDSAPNRGVVPLPNLDFKFVCADSLIPRIKNVQFAFTDDPLLDEKLQLIRKRYFNTSNEDKKNKLKSDYEALIADDLKLFQESQSAQQLKTFRPFTNNSRAAFFDPETMFGFPTFDIVIGNPPYISALAAKKILPAELREQYKFIYKSASGAYDMYLLFLELGLNLLSENGNLVLITPTKFLSAKYSESFRAVASKSLYEIADFDNARIFESAGVSTVVSFYTKNLTSETQEVICNVYEEDYENPSLVKIFPRNSLFEFPEQTWGHLKWGDYDLVSKIYGKSVATENIFEVVASSTAAEADDWSKLISSESSSSSYKMINTGTIRKFISLWGTANYSNKKDKILKPYLETKNIGDRRLRMFQSPKIVIAKLSKNLRACLDVKGEFASSNSVFVIDDNSPYSINVLAAIMNSSLMEYIYRSSFSGLNLLGSFQYQAPQIRILPIPKKVSKELVRKIELKVIEILRNDSNSVLLEELMTELDRLVYQAYELLPSEVGTIEASIRDQLLESDSLEIESNLDLIDSQD
jgi:adenine-specific DNA-methyltransferase